MKRLLRILVTGLLLGLVLSRVDLGELGEQLRSVNPRLLLVGYMLHMAMVLLNSWRWQILVRAQQARIGLARLTSYYFVCMFFNSFMPTSIGGDVVRVIDLSRHTGRRSRAFASILVERVIGLYVLLPISLFGLIAAYRFLQGGRDIFLYLEALLVLILVGTLALLRVDRALGLLCRVPIVGRIVARPGVTRRVASVQEALDTYRGHGSALAVVFLISVASRVVWIGSCFVFGLALGAGAPFVSYFLVVPLVEVARMVPISLAGLGIREGAFVLLFSYFGVASTVALGLSILVYAPFLLNGLIGGVLYALRGKAERIEPIEGAG